MLHDIVVDTNVFAHASDPRNAEFTQSLAFIDALLNCDTKLAVDEIYSQTEAENRSAIFSEYLEQLQGFDLASSVISKLIDDKRIFDVATSVSQSQRNIINQNVPDSSDRKFVKVTINTRDKVLVSNDAHDFSSRFRKLANSKLNIEVLFAAEALNCF